MEQDVWKKLEKYSISGERNRGRIRWFDNEKGYGFICSENEGKDIFVHYSNLKMNGYKSVEKDQLVDFILEENEKGLVAKDVKIILV